MIVDHVMFDNEFDMLDCRLYQLEGIVDQFVICEADHTFSGIPKPYHLSEAIAAGRYADHPITVVRAETKGDGTTEIMAQPWIYPETAKFWWREGAQRSAANGLLYRLPDDAVVMYGDLDEIPRRHVVRDFNGPPARLVMKHLVYTVRHQMPSAWPGTVIGQKGDLGPDPSPPRAGRMGFPGIANAGWHLSWFGGAERRERKLTHSAHQELVAVAGGNLASLFPEQGIHVDGSGQLVPYEEDLPPWVEDGFAPPEWLEGWLT